MKKLLLVLALCLPLGMAFAQEQCGFDQVINLQKQDPEFVKSMNDMNRAIEQYRINHPDNSNERNNGSLSTMAVSGNAIYVIPVVVHIVLDPGNSINNTTVSYAQVQSQIDALNAAYAKNTLAYNGQAPGPLATDTKIQFCLAQTAIGPANWPNLSEPGVMRYNSAVLSANQMTIPSTNSLIATTNPPGYFPFNKFLNIWVVNSIGGNCSGIQGYSILPLGPQFGLNGFSIDGVVVRADAFGDNSTGNTFTLQPHNLYGAGCPTAFAVRNQGKTVIHEVGHYLNLWHTFQNDIITNATCAGSTPGTCMSSGDFCCDTPPSNVVSTFPCGSSNPNSCGVPDLIEDYMFYSQDPCWNTFTPDQTTRMTAHLNLYRSTLFTKANLVATGVIGTAGCIPAGLFADFTYSPNPPCINQPISLNITVPFPANTANAYSWTMTGGSPATSASSNPTVTYTVPGNYTVTLTVTDGVNPAATYSTVIAVGSCVSLPQYVHNSQWYFGQYAAINFSSGSPVPINVARVNQTVFAMEGAYSYADNAGNLLFYTDGINVWNSAHVQINGSPVFPTTAGASNTVTSTIQSSTSAYGLIGAPFPNTPNKYYLFCAPATEDGLGAARYVILDLGANTVSAPQNFTPTGQSMCEALTIAPHCNGVDYWIITHVSGGGTPRFYIYLLSQLGLSNTPVTSSAFAYRLHTIASLKVSPDNLRIAAAGGPAGNPASSDIAVYNFNNSTGVISGEQILDMPGVLQFSGCSFSPNSQQVYCGNDAGSVVQFDLPANTSQMTGSGVNNARYMQLAPDGNIYIGCSFAAPNNQLIARVTNPNVTVGSGGGVYTPAAVDFSTITPTLIRDIASMPNLIDGVQPAATTPSFSVTYNSCTNVTLAMNPCWGGYNYSWNFGDFSSPATGISTTHTYAGPGSYTVTCTLTVPGGIGSIVATQTVTIINPAAAITGPTGGCVNNVTPYIYSVPYINTATYAWTISPNGTIVSGNGSSQINVIWNSGTTGTVSVTITIGACTAVSTFNVTFDPTADLYIKDTQTPTNDMGVEPNPDVPWNIVDGVDVWVRNTPQALTSTNPNHYTNEHIHENAEWTGAWATGSNLPRIYVKVRNKGCTTVTATVHLYYHKFTLNDQWNTCVSGLCGSWQEIFCDDVNGNDMIDGTETGTCTSNVITLAPGQDGVIEQVWWSTQQAALFQDPTMTGARNEFCLLARMICSGGVDVITSEVNGISAGWNAKNSNNITQKNVMFVNNVPGIICNPAEFGNVSATARTINKLEMVDAGQAFYAGKNGVVRIDLGETLFRSWVKGGRLGSGIVSGAEKYDHVSPTGITHRHDHAHPDPRPYEVIVKSSNAFLENILLKPLVLEPLCAMFNFFPTAQGAPGTPAAKPFEYQLHQFESPVTGPLNYKFTGAVKYILPKPKCPKADAGQDVTIGKRCTTLLAGLPVITGATYTWRDNTTGKETGIGQSIQVSPNTTTSYELEIITPDGCVDYDVVTITVNPALPHCQPGCGTPDYSNQVLAANTTINGTVVISKTLEVPNGVTLTIQNSKVNLTDNAKISVKAGGKLVITNSSLRACDDTKKWSGIVVKGNNTDASQLVISGSTFMDAVTPVDLSKVIGASITGSSFDNGTTAITMDKCKGFTIGKNQFTNYDIGILATNSIVDVKSLISENYFSNVRIAVQLLNGNHSTLDIKCNVFDGYTEYAVYTDVITFKSQGSVTEGAGNTFVSNSTMVNHKLRHNGNQVTYYYEPSQPVTSGMNVTMAPAAAGPVCGAADDGTARAADQLAVEETGKAMDLYSVPNPNSGQATVYFNLGEEKQGELLIMDLYGKMITKMKVTSETDKVDVDCRTCESGIYILTLTNARGEAINKKMIITK